MVQKRMEVALDVILACIQHIIYNKHDFYNMQHIHFHKKYKKLTLCWVFEIHRLLLFWKFLKLSFLSKCIVLWKLNFTPIMIEYKVEPLLNYPQSERFLLEKHNTFSYLSYVELFRVWLVFFSPKLHCSFHYQSNKCIHITKHIMIQCSGGYDR